MAEFRLLVTDRAWPDSSVERERLTDLGVEIIEAPDESEQTLVELAADADAIATCWAQVTERVVRAAVKCRIIARFGIGLDNIAVDVASELGIPVTNVPDYCIEEVADHTLALLLAAARKVAFFHKRTKAGEYRLGAGTPLYRLRGKTAGLIGLGRIGQALVPRLEACGLEVIAHTPSGNDHGTGVRMVSLDDLLAASDFVSLNCPLTSDNHHLINAKTLGVMRPGAVLINTARGGLIDHAALATALANDQLAGVALDVFDPEPPDLSDPLFHDERVIATPHASFLSVESLRELRERTAEQIAAVFRGHKPQNLVNPHVWNNRRGPSRG